MAALFPQLPAKTASQAPQKRLLPVAGRPKHKTKKIGKSTSKSQINGWRWSVSTQSGSFLGHHYFLRKIGLMFVTVQTKVSGGVEAIPC